jgi:peptidoglycan/xylan/chitin deacetylase (PgdA/CDA1 family)
MVLQARRLGRHMFYVVLSSNAVNLPAITRRTFLAALAGSVAVAGCGIHDCMAIPRAAAAPGQPPPSDDPAAIAARYRGVTPTQWGMSLPGVATTFPASGRQIALTFDACPGACDDALLATLERNAVPALLFLNSRWIDAHPGRAEQLAANPLFEIGNHGTRHVPLSVTGRSAYGIRGTQSADEVVTEVWTNHTRIAALTGKPPTWFRPATAYYDATSRLRSLTNSAKGPSASGWMATTARRRPQRRSAPRSRARRPDRSCLHT